MSAMLAAALATAGTSAADAGTAPAVTPPATVTADVLPTVQVDGVVWSQVVVGYTVYATGRFTSARPAGAAPGIDETPRANLLAFDLTTGKLDLGFDHSLDGEGRAIAVSPDHTRLYVGGQFTQVDGQPRYRIAAFDLPSGRLDPTFHPAPDASVYALSTVADRVYAGGAFSAVAGTPRTKSAAWTSDGTLLPYAPDVSGGAVTSLVVTPDASKVVLGGRFDAVGGQPAYGIAGVDSTDGAAEPWQTNRYVRAYAGSKASVSSLRTDGQYVYGTTVSTTATMPTSNMEGPFAIDPSTGAVIWADDCHGDTYDSASSGRVLYVVGHTHDCSPIGGFGNMAPLEPYHRAMAWSKQPTAKNTGPDARGWNFTGVPAAPYLPWWPKLDIGSVTGMNQAAWSVVATAKYVVLAGEFPRVNGVAQQGFVRFAVTGVAPAKQAPEPNLLTAPTLRKSGTSLVASFASTWDRDSGSLTYRVWRDDKPVCTTTPVATSFWQLPRLTCTIKNAVDGKQHAWRVSAFDPDGNRRLGPVATLTS